VRVRHCLPYTSQCSMLADHCTNAPQCRANVGLQLFLEGGVNWNQCGYTRLGQTDKTGPRSSTPLSTPTMPGVGEWSQPGTSLQSVIDRLTASGSPIETCMRRTVIGKFFHVCTWSRHFFVIVFLYTAKTMVSFFFVWSVGKP
jgi:hypothetical protein